jgi:hypothetical protein
MTTTSRYEETTTTSTLSTIGLVVVVDTQSFLLVVLPSLYPQGDDATSKMLFPVWLSWSLLSLSMDVFVPVGP